MDPFLGEIRPFSGNFAPQGWALCNGQLLPIQSNAALFSLLGTTYGGNGTTNFAVPNLQGSAPVGMGTGPGLTPREQGEAIGSPTASLNTSQLPTHTHSWNASQDVATSNTPGDGVMASTSTALTPYQVPDASLVALAASAVGPTGGSQAHENRQPYLAVTYIIALQGVFPQRP